MTRYLTIRQAAELLSVSDDTIRRMLPELGAVTLKEGKAGKRLIRIPERAIEDYLRSRVILPPVPTKQVRPTVRKLERRRA